MHGAAADGSLKSHVVGTGATHSICLCSVVICLSRSPPSCLDCTFSCFLLPPGFPSTLSCFSFGVLRFPRKPPRAEGGIFHVDILQASPVPCIQIKITSSHSANLLRVLVGFPFCLMALVEHRIETQEEPVLLPASPPPPPLCLHTATTFVSTFIFFLGS